MVDFLPSHLVFIFYPAFHSFHITTIQGTRKALKWSSYRPLTTKHGLQPDSKGRCKIRKKAEI
jgi:hypothetical protein